MKSKFLCGDILFDEATQTPFLHDGEVTADGLGAVIGFTEHKGRLVLCRTSGKGNFQKGAKVRYATDAEKERLMQEIALVPDIPFYSCL